MLSTRAPNNLVYLDKNLHHRGDRDPDLEELCNIIDAKGMTAGDVVKKVYDATNGAVNLHYKTVQNWLDGKTKRPQNYTLKIAGLALGYTRMWTKL